MKNHSYYKSHPWHGISAGPQAPEIVTAFVEMVPTDMVKYEVDKDSGYLKVDRPQKFSNIVPAPYGFIPRTYCDDAVAKYCMEKTGMKDIVGDGDPIDILVITERTIPMGNVLIPVIPIGGFRMIDGGEADDKIIAVMKGDEVYKDWRNIEDCPQSMIARLKHYFLTYKEMPGVANKKVQITHEYGREEAMKIIQLAMQDYERVYPLPM